MKGKKINTETKKQAEDSIKRVEELVKESKDELVRG